VHTESPKPAKAPKAQAPPPPPAAASAAGDDDEDGGEYQVVDGAHDDEYRWRKYGQKIMKGSPYPRSYYKCTAPNCSAKKLVESMMKDGKEVTVASFRGTHSHPPPGGRKGVVSGGGGFSRDVSNPGFLTFLLSSFFWIFQMLSFSS